MSTDVWFQGLATDFSCKAAASSLSVPYFCLILQKLTHTRSAVPCLGSCALRGPVGGSVQTYGRDAIGIQDSSKHSDVYTIYNFNRVTVSQTQGRPPSYVIAALSGYATVGTPHAYLFSPLTAHPCRSFGILQFMDSAARAGGMIANMGEHARTNADKHDHRPWRG